MWWQILAIAAKDIRTEFRSRDTIIAMLVFCLLVVIIFNFTFDPGSRHARASLPGMMWVAFTFSSMLGLNRAFAREVDTESINGLLLAPVDRGDIFLGKFLANWLFMSLVELITLPIMLILFNVSFADSWLPLITVVLLASIGFIAIGTLLSAMAVHTKTRELMLPILLFPILIPMILAAVNATAQLLDGDSWGEIWNWLKILIAFDLIFVTAGYLSFNYIVEE